MGSSTCTGWNRRSRAASFSLAGYEGQVQVLPLSEPLFRRLGAAVKTPPPANSAARHFLAFLKRQYPDKPTDNP